MHDLHNIDYTVDCLNSCKSEGILHANKELSEKKLCIMTCMCMHLAQNAQNGN